MEVTLRGYREGDLAKFCRLDDECFAPAFQFDANSMREFVTQTNATVVVAEGKSEGIAGFVIVHLEDGGPTVGGYVVTLDVAQTWRLHGLAKQLMEEAEQRVLAAGAAWMGLHVFVRNTAAIAFYEKIGYARRELIPYFYGGRDMDAFVYRKQLGREY